MKIAHISDIHIRNLKFHDEYRRVFENLYKKLDEIRPDWVINTGDTAHTKTQISPEFVQLTSEFFRNIRSSSDAPFHIILGNHDLNLMNPDRQDAITPIVESIGDSQILLYKQSGRVCSGRFECGDVNLWSFSMADLDNFPKPPDWSRFSSDINIGLFHGSIANCVTDANWVIDENHAEYGLDIFDGLDFVLLGDIHKQQFFKNRRIAYAGSLIQQNFGEDLEKGFLLWDIRSKNDFTVTPVMLEGSRKFFTLSLDDNLEVPNIEIPEDCRLRISPPRSVSLVEQKEIERHARAKFKPHDLIVLDINHTLNKRTKVGKKLVDHESLRDLGVQEKLIREYFRGRVVSDELMRRILDLNAKYNVHVEKGKDEVGRNIEWKLKSLSWNNLFNYGQGNRVNFENLRGIVGLFAPNASGKSNFIDIITETLFDKVTKEISKNIHLVNDNKESASSTAEFVAGGQNYRVERNIEKLKYGQKKFVEAKEWGKTTVDFFDEEQTLNGDSRPETEREIRKRVGTFEDFMLTSLTAQWNPLDIIGRKETERKKILYKFLDLDMFEDKCLLAKEEGKSLKRQLDELDEDDLEDALSKLRESDAASRAEIKFLSENIDSVIEKIRLIDDELLELGKQKSVVACDVDGPETKRRFETVLNELISLGEKKFGLLKELSLFPEREWNYDLDGLRTEYRDLSLILDSITRDREELQRLDSERRTAIDETKLLQQVPCGDQFPTCRFLVNAFNKKETIPQIEEKIFQIRSNFEDAAPSKKRMQEIKDLIEQHAEITKHNQKRQNLCLQIENVNLKIENLTAQKEKLEADMKALSAWADQITKNIEIDSQIEALKEERRLLNISLSERRRKYDESNKSLGQIQAKLELVQKKQEELRSLKESYTAWELYIEAMGKDGIPCQILAEKLPLINEEINKILSNGAEFNVFIEHDADEQSIRLYLQYGDYKSRLIELASGAEKMIASVAIRMALIKVSSIPKTDIFIIDEGFGKLDPRNIEAVGRMFDYLRTMFQTVIVISHTEMLKDMVDNTIDISSDEEGYAHIEVN